ncbi:phosphotransferase family protein [Haloechinothrix sp. YIM 98757]|uniref:Phosphotransferase family protein n=1 Tax=Haloechinothrix aidingensis TaxID=2752311 RepID=A0A838AB56_9PSEU|nr:phosphotransferase family protein [Haloechinothrix aidingensis]MBA0126471.1 phosphotransferase family protein [Haloechinothrix aidingensis]
MYGDDEPGDELPGLDLARLRTYLGQAAPDLVSGELRGSVIAGGRSNLTYEVGDGRREWVVRRPPLGHVLATAHDMGREYRVMTALGPSPVPVPRTVLLCEDTEVLGAPFYVMEKAPGTAYRNAHELERLGAERVRALSTSMIEVLAELHAVDPTAAGLADFGRPDGFLPRQVRRWKKQLDASRARPVPGIDELHERLESRVPEQSPTAVVHGDYRLDNLLVDERDEITAVLDWEMATLGDPLTDVALLATYRGLSEIDDSAVIADASDAPGFPGPAEILDHYARVSGRDLGSMGFYLGLAHFKLAVILEGIHFRYTQGKTVGEGFDSVGGFVEPIVSAGLDALEES